MGSFYIGEEERLGASTLDTHIWLWSLLEPERLTCRVARELEDPKNGLWLSPISTWELLVLHEKRRIVLNEDARTWIAKAMVTIPVSEAPVTHEVALETLNVTLPHRDPADRFLVATARVFELTLITADERLTACRDIRVLPNR